MLAHKIDNEHYWNFHDLCLSIRLKFYTWRCLLINRLSFLFTRKVVELYTKSGRVTDRKQAINSLKVNG